MCGISGIFSKIEINQTDVELVNKMNDIQKHRGPDDEGLYFSKHCVLGHRRLSIIDLSRNGHQPFSSDDGRFQLVYNGEIYNYIELRDELKQLGWEFRTKTDTEVLLKAYQQYGRDCLSKFNGMFAFAVYDSKEKHLFLARDRFGIKPLYYTEKEGVFYFSSEIKALMKPLKWNWSVNYQSVFDYFAFNRTDVFDETFTQEIKRIPKGHYGIVDKDGLHIKSWWSSFDYIHRGDINTIILRLQSTNNSIELFNSEIEKIFLDAVKLRMRSDVPVGSCLSGGLDSSILVGSLFAQDLVDDSFKTFTASFPNNPIDEKKYVDDLRQVFPFQNHCTFPDANTAMDNLEDFVYFNDEPTTSASFYSQYEVMRLAKEHGITVLLDGQGGDENFAGYHYFHGFHLYGLLRSFRLIAFSHEIIKSLIRKQDISAYQTLLYQMFPKYLQAKSLYHTIQFLSRDFYNAHIRKSRIFNEFFDAPDLNTSLARHFQYKLEHLLRMEDRNSMAFSLEARVPYLDYRLVEKLLSVPANFKIHAGETKRLQKSSLGRYTTPLILSRKDKIGFGTPMQDWLATPEWRKQTQISAHYCEEAFPEIFKKDFINSLSEAGFNRWKINQFALWHQMFYCK